MHILIVEDDTDTQELYKRMLKKLDAEITVIGDGALALDYIENTIPDILILDVNLPGVSGLNILKTARMKLRIPSENMKIVIATANIIARGTPEAKMADAYIEKPLRPKSVIETISKLYPITQ